MKGGNKKKKKPGMAFLWPRGFLASELGLGILLSAVCTSGNFVLFVCMFVWRVSLYSLSWPRTRYVEQVGLKFTEIHLPLTAGVKGVHHPPGPIRQSLSVVWNLPKT